MSDTTVDVLDDDDGALGEHEPDGPSGQLQDLLTIALAGPSVIALQGTPAHGELVDRISACREWSDLSEADRELLQRGMDETRAGQSPTLIDPRAYASNWAVEDYLADVEAGVVSGPAPAVDDDDEAVDDDDDEGESKSGLDLPDLDGWVGLE